MWVSKACRVCVSKVLGCMWVSKASSVGVGVEGL